MFFAEFALAVAATPITPCSSSNTSVPAAVDVSFEFSASQFSSVLQGMLRLDRLGAAQAIEEYVYAQLLYLVDPLTSVRLRPTSKGLAAIEEWFYVYGTTLPAGTQDTISKALFSECNSLKMLVLQRESATGAVQLSVQLAAFLWRRVMGPEPRIYGQPEKRSTARRNVVNERVTFDFCTREARSCPETVHDVVRATMSSAEYWDNQGIGVLETFSNSGSEYVFTGESVAQWLLRCASVCSLDEAQALAEYILAQGFSEQLHFQKLDASPDVYKITRKGMAMVSWTAGDDPRSTQKAKSRCEGDGSRSRPQSTLSSVCESNGSGTSMSSSSSEPSSYSAMPDSGNGFSWPARAADPGYKALIRDLSSRELMLFLDLTDSLCSHVAPEVCVSPEIPRVAHEVVHKYVLPDAPLCISIPQNLKREMLEAYRARDAARFYAVVQKARQLCFRMLDEDICDSLDAQMLDMPFWAPSKHNCEYVGSNH